MLIVLINELAYQNTYSAMHSGDLPEAAGMADKLLRPAAAAAVQGAPATLLSPEPGAQATGEAEARRAVIDRALLINRYAVTALTLLAALGLGLYARRWLAFEADRSRLELDLRRLVNERTGDLSKLAGHLLTAREDEKAHLARELHDELGALLTAAKFDVARMRGPLCDSPALLQRLDQLNQRLNEGISLKRRIVEDLRPSSLATLGLSVSLQNLCADVSSSIGITIATEFEEVNLGNDGLLAAYRLVQEALNNVTKYAAAKNVKVSVHQQQEGILVRIEDDGVGFDTAASLNSGHGLAGMRFRVEQLHGRFSVTSSRGQGTRLEAVLPAGC